MAKTTMICHLGNIAFESGKTMGRIYRIITENRRAGLKSKIDLSKLSAKELVAEFNNPNIWWRMTAQRLLLDTDWPLKEIACRLGFAHPSTGERLVFESPLPEALQRYLDTLRHGSGDGGE